MIIHTAEDELTKMILMEKIGGIPNLGIPPLQAIHRILT